MTYRRFDSSYGWDHPRSPGWLGFTWALRLGLVILLILAVTGRLG